MKKALSRTVTVMVGVVSATCFGFTGAASAQYAVSNTGPGSYVAITDKDYANCTVTNTNNLNLTNNTHQKAHTGDATSSYNTNAGGGWGNWNPSTWQSQGYTYDQWHSAFMQYMNSVHGNWGSGHGGGVTSGAASNSNNTATNVSVDNDANCAMPTGGSNGSGGGSTTVSNTGPHSTTHVLGSSTTTNTTHNNTAVHSNNNTHQGAYSGNATSKYNTHQGAYSGNATSKYNTNAGSAHTGNSMNGNSTSTGVGVSNSGGYGAGHVGGAHTGGSHGGYVHTPHTPAASKHTTVSNTGPHSKVHIDYNTTHKTTVTNTNDVKLNNNTNQHAHTGDATSSYNTNAGSVATGAASNSNNTSTMVQISN